MEDKLKIIARTLGEERVRLDENITEYTYLKKKASAQLFYIATTPRELIRILDLAYELKVPYLVIGGGTKLVIKNVKIKGAVIKNRTSNIRVAGIKGRVGRGGIGVKEALFEVDSGVTINKLNNFLLEQNFENISGFSSLHSTIGGSLFVDNALRNSVQKLKVWEDGEVSDLTLNELTSKHIVISAIFKFKPKEDYV